MSYKNTMKLFASNFTLVWKQVLYLIICLLLFVLSSSTVVTPIINLLRSHDVFAECKIIIETVYNSPSEFALQLSTTLKHIFEVIFTNFSSITWSFVGTICLCVILPYILVQMSFYNLTSILYQKLSMNMNVNYIQNGFQNLTKSLRFALANIVISLPFLAIIVLLLEIYLMLATNVLNSIIGLIILCALLIMIFSFKVAIYTCYTAYMVDNNSSAFVAFGKGLVMVLKNYWKTLSASIIIILTIIFVNSFITVFTFFSGLFITIPATFVFLAIFYLVVYFNNKGDRYYLGNNLIYNPSQYSIKQDNFTGTDIPEPEEIKEITVKTTVMKKKRSKTKTEKQKSKSKKSK